MKRLALILSVVALFTAQPAGAAWQGQDDDDGGGRKCLYIHNNGDPYWICW